MASRTISAKQKRRFQIITQEIGCVPCRIEGDLRGESRFRQAQANHQLNGYRKGHDHTDPECPWHHMGQFPGEAEWTAHWLQKCVTSVPELTLVSATMELGPCRALNKPEFHERYGSDADLLEYTNHLVEEFETNLVQ